MRPAPICAVILLALQLRALPVAAVDCVTSFDQGCLSQPYDSTKVEQNYADRERQMNTAIEEEEEKAAQALAAARAAAMQAIQEQPTAAQEEQDENARFYIAGRLPGIGRTQPHLQRSSMFRSFRR